MEQGPYTLRILRVDLSSGTVSEELIDGETTEKYVGGTGLGTKYLWDEVLGRLDDKLLPMNARSRQIYDRPGWSATTWCSMCSTMCLPLSGVILTVRQARSGTSSREWSTT